MSIHLSRYEAAKLVQRSAGVVPPEAIGALPTTAFVGLAHVYVQNTAPENPNTGDLWVDTSS